MIAGGRGQGAGGQGEYLLTLVETRLIASLELIASLQGCIVQSEIWSNFIVISFLVAKI